MKRNSRVTTISLVVAFSVAAIGAGGSAAIGSLPKTQQESSSTPAPAVAAADTTSAYTVAYTSEGDAPSSAISGTGTESTSAAPLEITYPAPAAVGSVDVTLGASSIIQYWWFASGTSVTAEGFEPNETVTITDTTPSGKVFTYAPVKANASGKVSTRISHRLVEPDNNEPEPGQHMITVTGENGMAGAAPLTVSLDTFKKLTVSLSRTTISQDEFLDQPVDISVSGLKKFERLYFNLILPDGSGQAVSQSTPLYADENGEFTYSLQALSSNSEAGKWTVSIVSTTNDAESGLSLSGSASFQVTPGAERVIQGSIAMDSTQMTEDEFANGSGAAFALSGFQPFEPYQLSLITPRGAQVTIGQSRVNGEGYRRDGVYGSIGTPLGTYTVEARSMTTGAYVRASFTVTDSQGNTQAAPTVTVTPDTLTAAQATSSGFTISGTGFLPYRTVTIALRDSAWIRQAFVAGPEVYVNTDANGAFTWTGALLSSPAAGQFMMTFLQSNPNGANYRIERSIPVTILAAEESPSSAATTPEAQSFSVQAPSAGVGTPSTPTDQSETAAPSAPATENTPEVTPSPEETTAPVGPLGSLIPITVDPVQN